ncbi:MAG: NRDE family protein [Alcanivoracaceae bacterium]|nr:NRDE family protein [Alcanivoracaceae bacterium]
MCTLSIFRQPTQTIITMNRDEARNRYEANIIKQVNNNTIQFFYPIDQLSTGTWFGFNNYGIVLALLNGYHQPHTDNAKSRGCIIPSLLKFDNLRQIEQKIDILLQHNFNPFDLVYTDTTRVIKFNWNGTNLLKDELSLQYTSNPQAYMFSSSSVDTQNILSKRADIFSAFRSNNAAYLDNPEYILSNLHLQQDNSDSSGSILMSRFETHTKSISQIVMNNKKLDYYYIDETQMAINSKLLPYRKCHHKNINLKS